MENNNNQFGQDNSNNQNDPYYQNNSFNQNNQYNQSNIYGQNGQFDQNGFYGQNQYQQNPYGQNNYPPQRPQNGNGLIGFSISSMVIGIVALLCSCFPYIPLILGLLAVALGGIGIAKNADGKGMAIAGLILGIITVVWGILYAIAIAAAADISYSFYRSFI